MTATQDATSYAPVSVNTRIGTEFGPVSVEDLRQIADLEEKGAKSAALARETKKLADAQRSIRDVAGLVLIQPYQEAQRPYDDTIAAIDAQLEANEMTRADAWAAKQVASETRRDGMESVQYKPVHVYRDIIGVSRGLFVRMQHREPKLPAVREFLSTATVADPRLHDIIEAASEDPWSLDAVAAVGLFARDECKRYDAVNKRALEIRDEAGLMLLNGNPKVGRPAMSNADVARLFKLTTARVAQMRYGTR